MENLRSMDDVACDSCEEYLVCNPDGSVSCCCKRIESDSNEIPARWNLTLEVLDAFRF